MLPPPPQLCSTFLLPSFLAPKNGTNGFIQEFCAKLLLSRASCNFARKKGCRRRRCLGCLIYDHWVMLAN